MEFICTYLILVLFAGFTCACISHYDYCSKIQYLKDVGYEVHKHDVGYDKYVLYFTKGVITIYEEELFKLTLKELKEKYR